MAAVRALDAIDIEDDGFRDALEGGVTTAVVKPGSGNPIGGQTVAIKTWGGRTVDEQVIRAAVSREVGPRREPQARLPRPQGAALDAPGRGPRHPRGVHQARRNYADAREHAAAARASRSSVDLTQEVLARVLDGELVWDQHTHRHDDIATAIRLAEEFGYRLVVNHGTDGAKIADVLAEKDIPVIFGPMLTNRSKVELRDRGHREPRATSPRPACGSRSPPTIPSCPIQFLVHQASLAVKEGLDRDDGPRGADGQPGRDARSRRPGRRAGPRPRRRRRRLVGRPARRSPAPSTCSSTA